MRKNKLGDIIAPTAIKLYVTSEPNDDKTDINVQLYQCTAESIRIDSRDGSQYPAGEEIIDVHGAIEAGIITQGEFESTFSVLARLYDNIGKVVEE